MGLADFHSLRHTFCTNLHLAGVPQRETMELMRHTDPRLTAKTYADSSLFALSPAVGKLTMPATTGDDAQIDAQRIDFRGHVPSLAGAKGEGLKADKSPLITGLKLLSDAGCHEAAQKGEWCALQVSNLRPLPCEGNALPLS